MRFSASMIGRWMGCPKEAHFHDILKLPSPQHAKTTYGTCQHDALDLYNKTGNVEAAILRFKETWDDPGILEAEIDVWPQNTSWGDLRQRGIASILKYHEDNSWEDRIVVASEHPFLVPFGEHTLSGFVDYLEIIGKRKKRSLRVVDLKTSSYRPSHLQLRFNPQFTIYIYASEQPEFWEDIPHGEELFAEFEGQPRMAYWYSLWDQRMTEVGIRTDLDMMRLYRVVLEIEQAIKKEVFVPSLTGASCLYCPHTHLCAAVIPLREVVEEARAERVRK